jgi:hypothetical protein
MRWSTLGILGLVSFACARPPSSHPGDIGDVVLALTLPGGGIVNAVSYTITGNGISPITGTIDVSAPGTTAPTTLVSGLAAGSYSVAMMASSSDGQTCSGSAPFTVVAGQTALASVLLQCTRTNTRGSVAITGRIDQCPLITSISATSLQAPLGGAINIGVVVSDLDGDSVSYSWSASPSGLGSFGAQAANTTFTCLAVGNPQLSIAVTDGICGDSLTNAIPIHCVGAGSTDGGGNGGSDAGASCQPILNNGNDTGFDSCVGGVRRRRAALSCPEGMIDPNFNGCPMTPGSQCSSDAECTAQPLGYCPNAHHVVGYCGCFYGICRTDADCGPSSICECGAAFLGACVPAACATDASCGPGFDCIKTYPAMLQNTCALPAGGPGSYVCETAADLCHGDGDCSAGSFCSMVNNQRICLPGCKI